MSGGSTAEGGNKLLLLANKQHNNNNNNKQAVTYYCSSRVWIWPAFLSFSSRFSWKLLEPSAHNGKSDLTRCWGHHSACRKSKISKFSFLSIWPAPVSRFRATDQHSISQAVHKHICVLLKYIESDRLLTKYKPMSLLEQFELLLLLLKYYRENVLEWNVERLLAAWTLDIAFRNKKSI